MKVENEQLLQLPKGSLKKKKRACMGFELSTSAIEQTSQLGIMGKGEHSSVIIVWRPVPPLKWVGQLDTK